MLVRLPDTFSWHLADFNFTLRHLAVFLSVSETHSLWVIIIDHIDIDYMTGANRKE